MSKNNFEDENLFLVGILSATDKKTGSGLREGSVSHWYGSGSRSIPKCHESTTLERMKGKRWQGNKQDGKEFTRTLCAGSDCRGAEQRATRDEAGQPGAAQDQHHCAEVENPAIQLLGKRWNGISKIKIWILEAKSNFFPSNQLLQFCKLKGNFPTEKGKFSLI
jgi:hypothetical protein